MKGKLLKKLKRTLCYVLALGMISTSVLPARAEGKTDLTAGLVAYYDFETVADASVTNKVDSAAYAGTLSGTAVVSNEEGTFDNSLKYVSQFQSLGLL